MGYEIIYDKCFVKLSDNRFIPMIFGGSNNCIQFDKSDRGRRERNWFNDTYICGGNKFATRDEIMARIESIREGYIQSYPGVEPDSDKYDDKRFGYFAALAIGGSTRHTTFGLYRGLYVTGMNKALTIDQLKAEGVTIDIHTYSYNGETQTKCKELGIPFLGPVTVENEQHFFDTVKLFEDNYKDTGISWYVGYNEWNLEEKIRRIRKRMFPKSKKEYTYKEVDHFYTVEAPNGGYFHKFTGRGYRYSHYSIGHSFETEKEAVRFANSKKGRITLTVKRIDNNRNIRVPA